MWLGIPFAVVAESLALNGSSDLGQMHEVSEIKKSLAICFKQVTPDLSHFYLHSFNSLHAQF